MKQREEDIQQFLARIRKTIADSESLMSQAELRIAETDRMLERQGLTREQVMNIQFTQSQLDAANAELKKRGMDPLEQWSRSETEEMPSAPETPRGSEALDGELENRQKKFGMMMKPFQI
jgi:hypothetical protein